MYEIYDWGPNGQSIIVYVLTIMPHTWWSGPVPCVSDETVTRACVRICVCVKKEKRKKKKEKTKKKEREIERLEAIIITSRLRYERRMNES